MIFGKQSEHILDQFSVHTFEERWLKELWDVIQDGLGLEEVNILRGNFFLLNISGMNEIKRKNC